ncbi:hypothetical protein HDK77DRAFT_271272 [Phyllosticta capitalensis]
MCVCDTVSCPYRSTVASFLSLTLLSIALSRLSPSPLSSSSSSAPVPCRPVHHPHPDRLPIHPSAPLRCTAVEASTHDACHGIDY